jgi:hypothetical protein
MHIHATNDHAAFGGLTLHGDTVNELLKPLRNAYLVAVRNEDAIPAAVTIAYMWKSFQTNTSRWLKNTW